MSPVLGSEVKPLLLAVLIPKTFSKQTRLLELLFPWLCLLFLPAGCFLFAGLAEPQSAPSAMTAEVLDTLTKLIEILGLVSV